MPKMTVLDVPVKGKKVLVRVDFNVPLDENLNVSDDKRISAALPTIRYLIEHGAKVILCSHLGRPKGKPDPAFSLAPVAKRLAELLPGVNVSFASDAVGEPAQSAVAALKEGDIVLLENLRFHKEETDNDPGFARELASLAELYVSDAFGTVHRAHASTVGVAAYLPAVAGFLIGKELDVMGKALEDPERPFVAILGGAKVQDKIGVIKNLLTKCDVLLIGGGMAYTFFKAQGYEIGASLLDAESVELAGELLKEAKSRNVELLLPVDTVIAEAFAADSPHRTVAVDAMPKGMMGMDIGEKTAALYAEKIKSAGTVIWNGPMGVFEFPEFAKGTAAVAAACAECKGVTIIGGGDSASAVKKLGFAAKMTHISTGGGASLEYLEGKELPGVAALNDKR
ncbi:MAG: phosphoglycerate kinase [Bacillota bacterium]